MNEPLLTPAERLEELLATEALDGLTSAEQAELDTLLAQTPGVERDGFALAAAAMALADPRSSRLSLPADLRKRLRASAAAHFAETTTAPAATSAGPARVGAEVPGAAPRGGWSAGDDRPELPSPARTFPLREALAWLAAAACLTLAFWTWSQSRTRPEAGPALAEARAEMLRNRPDAVVWAWTATDDPAAQGASGDVVWSDAAQRGYLRFAGLAPNDPAREQYQLWIFSADQDERYPVDGGVFNVGPGGETIVPIDAKLAVTRPTLFAVTVEKPGGVVVSSRERLPLLAKPAERRGET